MPGSCLRCRESTGWAIRLLSSCGGSSGSCSVGIARRSASARGFRRFATGCRRTCRESPGRRFEALPFTPLYLTEDEFAAETENQTVYGVLHFGRIYGASGDVCTQMAILVKPNGALGAGYLAAIRPFRRLIVYPTMIRGTERELRAAAGDRTAAHA